MKKAIDTRHRQRQRQGEICTFRIIKMILLNISIIIIGDMVDDRGSKRENGQQK
jgi:hypothetical protein